MPEQTTFVRRISPLSASLFFGVAVDTLFLFLTTRSADAAGLPRVLPPLLFILPYFVCLPVTGFAADRLPKRYLMIACKLAEVILLVAVAQAVRKGCTFVVPVILLLMAIKSAFFSPAFYGILPETFREEELTQANGRAGAMGFLAVSAALPFLSILLLMPGVDFLAAILITGCLSFGGLLSAMIVLPSIPPLAHEKELAYSFRLAVSAGWRELLRKPSILLAALGEAFFLAVGGVLLMLIVLIMKQPVAGGGSGLAVTCMAPTLGISLGCFLAGMFSKHKIELGLAPFGALGVAVCLPLAAYFHGEPSVYHFFAPGLLRMSVQVYPPALFFLFLAGIGGGLFIIPLRAYFQQRVKPEKRGAAQAVENALCLLLLCFFVFLLAFSSTDRTAALDLSPLYALVAVLGAATFVVTLFSMWILPDFALRFLIIALGNTFYKTRILGAEHIPERGPALLLSNHVSFIDSILISACTSRRVRFLMHEDYYSVPLLSPVARLTGFIRVPGAGKHKSMGQMFDEVRKALRGGDIICVFPEGKMTRNGVMGRFSGGFEKMLPPDLNVPLIPVCIGNVWGSLFSYYSGRIRLRLPREIPYCSMVTFGAPLPPDSTAFEVRQRIGELAAESCMKRIPKERTLHYCTMRSARRHPLRHLLYDCGGETYTQLRMVCEAVLLSRELRRRVASDVPYIGVLLPNCCHAAVSLLGALYADKASAPLNPTTMQDVFESSIRKAGITHIVTTRTYLEKVRVRIPDGVEPVFLDEFLSTLPRWKKIGLTLAILLLPYKDMLNLISPLTCDEVFAPAALLFSSGSTGVPKGVVLTHHNLMSDVQGTVSLLGIQPGTDKITGNLPLFHSYGLNVGFWVPLSLGCPVVYLANPLDAGTMGQLLTKDRPTLLFATPSFLQIYMRKCPPESFQSLRLTFTGAEKLRSDIAEKFHVVMRRQQEIVEMYGTTEISPIVTVNLTPSLTDLGRRPGKAGSIGVALPNLAVRIVDPLTYRPVPPDSEGLLFVKGPAVMPGYLNAPELTQKCMIDGYYNTGDVARMDEAGYVTICGRLSRFSKIAGEMVPHEMVERIINEMFQLETRTVAVCGIPDSVKGEALLVLYTDDMPLTPEQVVEQLRERSISNLWIPKAANFARVKHLPLLGSGKLDLAMLHRTAERIAAERRA